MTVVTFGELMMRLSAPGHERFVQAAHFNVAPGGAEANVAVCAASLGAKARFVSKLPTNELGQWALNGLRAYGVDTAGIARGGPRIGIYYLEKGASQRPSKVVYDRAGSSFATATAADFNWSTLLEGADAFHFSGITPALSADLPAIVETALIEARRRGILTSCDLNYRRKLWTREQAGKVMSRLMPLVDLCIANEEDASDVFGIHTGSSDVDKGQLNAEDYRRTAEELQRRFGFSKVAITLRESLSADDNNWSGLLLDGADLHLSKRYRMHIVDRVGGGDSFSGGLIYALLDGQPPGRAIDFAVACSCLKHSIEGDFNPVSLEEVNSLLDGEASGRVQR